MCVAWKKNWPETRRHFVDWWTQRGLVVTVNGLPRRAEPREAVGEPPSARSPEEHYVDGIARARREHHRLAHADFPLDNLPMPECNVGPGSLALLLGSEPGFSRETVWFKPAMDEDDPESHPELTLDPNNRWLKVHEDTLSECVRLGQGKYVVGCPDLIENIDILAALRDPELLLYDMVERPEWVERQVLRINQLYFQAYSRIYDIIKLPDGSSCFDAFHLWGPGKVAKVQCDASAMFSPAMFERFVVPALTEQCEWLDHSMFHLDGHQCIPHLDLLLRIEALDAIEWTPDPQVPSGGNLHWAPMYQRILAAGKSVQAIGVGANEVKPLLDAVGPSGMYLMVGIGDERELETLERAVEAFR
jgi:hypothetical protein